MSAIEVRNILWFFRVLGQIGVVSGDENGFFFFLNSHFWAWSVKVRSRLGTIKKLWIGDEGHLDFDLVTAFSGFISGPMRILLWFLFDHRSC